jgi:hypothetical protein
MESYIFRDKCLSFSQDYTALCPRSQNSSRGRLLTMPRLSLNAVSVPPPHSFSTLHHHRTVLDKWQPIFLTFFHQTFITHRFLAYFLTSTCAALYYVRRYGSCVREGHSAKMASIRIVADKKQWKFRVRFEQCEYMTRNGVLSQVKLCYEEKLYTLKGIKLKLELYGTKFAGKSKVALAFAFVSEFTHQIL